MIHFKILKLFLLRRILFCAVLFNAALVCAQVPLPTPIVETLPSGLKVAWFVDNRLPVLDLSLVVQAGQHEDPVGKSGTAELTAASLGRGAGGLTAAQISQAVDSVGGIQYTSADEDSTIVGMHGLAPDGPRLLKILSQLILLPEFSKSQVEIERSRLLDRWSRMEDYSAAWVTTTYQRILAGDSLYGRGGVGTLEELKKLGRDDVEHFYRKYFTPKNSILVVIGRVDPSVFRSEIVSTFGSWGLHQGPTLTHFEYKENEGSLPKKLPSKVALKKGAVVLMDRPGLTQAQIRMGFRVPSVKAPEHYPLLVANALVGGYFGSRLNTEIRDKLALTYGINSTITYNKEFSEFTVSTAARNESVGPLIRRVTDLLVELKTDPIPVSEVDTAKAYLVGGFPLLTSTLEAVASRWLTGYVFNLGPDFLNEFNTKVQAVTAQEVQKAVQKSFDVNRMVIVVAGDAKVIKKSLSQAKAGFGVTTGF